MFMGGCALEKNSKRSSPAGKCAPSTAPELKKKGWWGFCGSMGSTKIWWCFKKNNNCGMMVFFRLVLLLVVGF